MTSIDPNLSTETIAGYRSTATRRIIAHQHEITIRKERAWELARQAAAMVRANFSATSVVVFGSLIHPGCFNQWSDVDIAAWGIPADLTLRAMGAVLELDNKIEINLVDVNTCQASLLVVIEREGQPV
jgi:predicted nucleotidyltransferase